MGRAERRVRPAGRRCTLPACPPDAQHAWLRETRSPSAATASAGPFALRLDRVGERSPGDLAATARRSPFLFRVAIPPHSEARRTLPQTLAFRRAAGPEEWRPAGHCERPGVPGNPGPDPSRP